ncbi:MAG: response regulator [Aerococcaceae bacterium]|nr:response regulator [Aerococcaceae bacterium]
MDRVSQTLNVLIVDDEFMIIKGLERLIQWEQLGLTLVGTASNGVEALNVMAQTPVDIVISDINMPLLNGIDFITAAREKYTAFELVFISGYQEFQYVKSGMELGAVNYLLKPIDKVELNRVLTVVVERIKQQQYIQQALAQQHVAQEAVQTDNVESNSPKGPYHPLVDELLAIVHERYTQDISLKELADTLHVNVMYLGQIFRKEVGQTFAKYLNQHRVAIAKERLQHSRLSVSEVGYSVGYQNQAYFYKIFKEIVGVSPKEYRKQQIQ